MGPTNQRNYFFGTKLFDDLSGHGCPRRKSWTSAPKNAFSCGHGGGRNFLTLGHPGVKVKNVRGSPDQSVYVYVVSLPWKKCEVGNGSWLINYERVYAGRSYFCNGWYIAVEGGEAEIVSHSFNRLKQRWQPLPHKLVDDVIERPFGKPQNHLHGSKDECHMLVSFLKVGNFRKHKIPGKCKGFWHHQCTKFLGKSQDFTSSVHRDIIIFGNPWKNVGCQILWISQGLLCSLKPPSFRNESCQLMKHLVKKTLAWVQTVPGNRPECAKSLGQPGFGQHVSTFEILSFQKFCEKKKWLI